MISRNLKILAYGGPLLFFAGEAAVRLTLDEENIKWFFSESGPFELIEAAIAGLGLIWALFIFPKLKDTWLKVWIGAAALGCLYIVGEELSWGQWIFNWNTPEAWMQINDQNETNLHNTSTWLDQKPRALLEIGMLVGGCIVPALRKWKPEKLPEKFALLYPSNIVVFTTIMAICVKLINFFGDATQIHLFYRGSEMMELLIYYFVLLYLIDFKNRLIKD